MWRKPGSFAVFVVALALAAAGCGSDDNGGGGGGGGGGDDGGAAQSGKALNAADLGPEDIIGSGPNGEPPASVDDLKLSDEEVQKVKDKKFKIGLVMHTEELDWSKLQIKGITDTLKEYGAEVIGVTNAEFEVPQQIGDIENMIQRRPDAIISIPVDDTATATAYKKIAQAGIKLIFMDNVPKGLKHPQDYSSMISADSQGNGMIAGQVIANQIPDGGKLGIIGFGIDFFVTNERVEGVKNWVKENRPDIKIVQADFSEPDAAGSVAENFLTANPDVKGLFVVWDQPAMAAVTAARAVGTDVPISTIDLGLEAAIEIGSGGSLKGLGAQRPYDQGAAEALAALNALLGKETPAWVGVQSLAVIQSNILEAYEEVWKEAPPKALTDACESSGGCG